MIQEWFQIGEKIDYDFFLNNTFWSQVLCNINTYIALIETSVWP